MADETVPVQVALGAAGACPVIEWQGKRYTVGHPTQEAKAFYEDELIEAEKRKLDTLLNRRLISRAKYDERLEFLGGRIDRMDHKQGGSLWMDYALGADAETGTGAMAFLYSLMRPHHPELTYATVREMSEGNPGAVMLAMRRVVPDFFAWAGEVVKTILARKGHTLTPQQAVDFDRGVREAAEQGIAQLFGVEPPPPTGTTP